MSGSTVNRRTFVGQLGLVAAAPFVRARPQDAPLRANGARVNGWLAQVRRHRPDRRAASTGSPTPTRTWPAARSRSTSFATPASTPRIDAAGNILARLEGREPVAAADPDRLARRLGHRRRQLRRAGRQLRRDRGRALAPRAERAAAPPARGRRSGRTKRAARSAASSRSACSETGGPRRGGALGQDAARGHRPRRRHGRPARRGRADTRQRARLHRAAHRAGRPARAIEPPDRHRHRHRRPALARRHHRRASPITPAPRRWISARMRCWRRRSSRSR